MESENAERVSDEAETEAETVAENMPAAKSKESPGKNGVNTKPVSAKMIANKMPYVTLPYCAINSPRCTSICKIKSINPIIVLYKKKLCSTRYYTMILTPSQLCPFHIYDT